MVQLALRSALSDRALSEHVAVIDEWPWTQPKTADAKAALSALGLDGKVLIVLDREKDHNTYRSFRNLPHVQLMLTGELNAYDVLCNDWIVFARYNLPGTATEVDESTATAAPTPAPTPVSAPEPEAPVVNEADPVEGAPGIPVDDEPDTTVAADAAPDSEETDTEETDTEETPS
jgi:large subunit ribosomal protein L4